MTVHLTDAYVHTLIVWITKLLKGYKNEGEHIPLCDMLLKISYADFLTKGKVSTSFKCFIDNNSIFIYQAILRQIQKLIKAGS